MSATTDQLAAFTQSLAQFSPVAAGVRRLAVVFVNLYVIDTPGGFVLVDTGVPASAWYVRKAVAAWYGPDARPEAIVLTHAHFDHAGNAKALADAWAVPVYVHDQELPYVTGRSNYAPPDPTPGGAICFLSRAFPVSGIDLGDRVRVLPPDGTVPHLDGWQWVYTPGHSAGHVSFFRASDGVLLSGDALATVDLDSWSAHLTWPREFARPATPFTPDWVAARASIHRLADLRPKILAAGHGLPMYDPEMEKALRTFARAMEEPAAGRYSGKPAQYAPDGALADVPPPAPDPVLRNLAIAGGAVGVIAGAALAAAAVRKTRADD